jgi:hypothetical protein
MGYCGVVEVQSLEDALGATCGYRARAACSDCGVSVCSAHAQACTLCHEIFCPSCLSFHQAQHAKPTKISREGRRSARTA